MSQGRKGATAASVMVTVTEMPNIFLYGFTYENIRLKSDKSKVLPVTLMKRILK
ncbi:MAG: hypothetical protein JNL63_00615 [Bacteroidia bacterium]|nr:hypothetical protein [Bacteroidia bacterium]